METGFCPRNIFQGEQMPDAPNADSAAAAATNWGIRSFEEALTGPHVGATWPPRSYACAFCGREFKSAQALGGHMNIHRRDRARLRQSSHASNSCPSTAAASPARPNIVFPPPPQRLAAELVASGGGILLLCPIGASAGPVFAQAAAASPTARSGQGEAGAVVEELDLELRLGR